MNMTELELTSGAIKKEEEESHLSRCLTGMDLILLGIGAIVGAGIFVLTGIAAATKAGPAIIISFIVAGIASTFSALSYAELSSSLGGCGSAYGYARVGFGQAVAWVIGWALLLEYGVSCAAVAVGWSAYADTLLQSIGIHLPHALLNGPAAGGYINLPALLIVSAIALLLIIGAKTSARFNAIIVFIKLAVIALFIVIASRHIDTANWHHFAPFGVNGVMAGAAFIFFAFIGFDAVSTAAEETINPQRNLPFGIIGSLIVCTVLFIIVSGLLTLIVPYNTLSSNSPIADALLRLGYRVGASIISVGAIAGLTTVILVMYYGLTRVVLALSRDHLIPSGLSKINHRTRTPMRIIILAWVAMAIMCCFVPIDPLVSIANIGTLTAFAVVCAGVMTLRYTQPDMPRPFRTPFSPLIPILGILSCLYLIYSLSPSTWVRFIIWLAVGIVIYFAYSRKNVLKFAKQ